VIENTGQSRYQVRAVARALDLLFVLGDLAGPADLTTLARRAGLHPSTAFRMLETLRTRGLVRSARDGYELGAATFELGSAFLRGVSVWTNAPELAEQLAGRADETASVGVLDNGEVLYIAIAHGQRELGIQWQPGTRHPAHATALGKAMLAHLPWPEVTAILARRPLVRLTPRTFTDPAALRSELAAIAARGYAVDDEERLPGVFCIGAPIRDHNGSVVAAISISGPAFRIAERGPDELARLVVAAAGDASRRLGAPEETAAASDPRRSGHEVIARAGVR